MNNTLPTSKDEVFLAQIYIDANPRAYERLCTIRRGMRYDMNLYGLWIEKSSTAYSLANILGLRLYDPTTGPEIRQPRHRK